MSPFLGTIIHSEISEIWGTTEEKQPPSGGFFLGNSVTIATQFPQTFPTVSHNMSSITAYPGGFRVQLYVKGQRDSETFVTKRDAQAWAASRESEMRRESLGKSGETKTLRDALRRFATEVAPARKGCRWETVRLSMFEKVKSLPLNTPLTKLRADQFTAWKLDRLTQVAPGSVKREMSLLGSVLSYARRDWGWMTSNPLSDVRRPTSAKHRKRIITGTEIRTMLRQLGYSPTPTAVSHQVAYAFLFALSTGMRAGEIVGISWNHVNTRWVVLEDTKNGQTREVPLSKVALKLLDRLKNAGLDKPMGVKSGTLDVLFRRARDKAGLSGFTFHDSRHTAATRVGASVGQPGRLSFPEFCKVFGWSDPRFAMVYVNPLADTLAGKL